MRELNQSIQRWLEKNIEYIDFVVPIENSLTTDPVQVMFCGPMAHMQQALEGLASSGVGGEGFGPAPDGQHYLSFSLGWYRHRDAPNHSDKLLVHVVSPGLDDYCSKR